jgi:hypothetical protein
LEVNSSIFKLRALPLLGGVNPQDVKELKLWEFILYAWAPVPSGIYLVDI